MKRIPVATAMATVLVAGFLLGAVAPAVADDEMSGIGDLRGDERIVHVLNRLGYGPRPGELDEVRQTGLYRWIVLQLHPERIPDEACEKRLAELPLARASATALATMYGRRDPAERKAYSEKIRRVADLRKMEKPPRDELNRLQKEIRDYRKMTDRNQPLYQLLSAKVIRAVESERQLQQVMADFWFNHFNVFGRKGQTPLLIPEYEERVIRPHALGKFKDLLVAVAKSPAMLYYLDNWLSIAPPDAPVLDQKGRPRKGRRYAKDRGLNENYARELLELHTVGVDNGYTQKDIVDVARCFTGWTITSLRGDDKEVTFRFRQEVHDAGPKRVMGMRVRGGGGIEDGMEVLDFLAGHPNTAYFISEKLCRRFVSDEPPRALVERCAGTFLESDGDIRLVLYRIFTSPEFFSREAAQAKLKKPSEYAISAMRALGVTTDAPLGLVRTIGQLGEPLYFCEPPTGFPDVADRWGGSNAILARVGFATQLALGRVRGAKPDWRSVLEGAPDGDARGLADHLVRTLHGMPLSPATDEAIQQAVARAGAEQMPRRRAGREEAAGYLAALVLGSPDFQMR
jgi:uncharacterized protein (DUF1800 family)